jgi:hypothetical protein
LADLGIDFAGVTDLDPTMPVITGNLGLAHAVARRLTTPAGSLIEDPNYGFDTRLFLNAVSKRSFLLGRIADECLKEERVSDVDVTVEFLSASSSLTINIALTVDDGATFDLTLNVSSVTAELLLSEA